MKRLNEEKNKLWQEIQSRDAQLAAFLVELNKVFGKPKEIKVRFKGNGGRHKM